MCLYPEIEVEHPGQPNDLWDWAKDATKTMTANGVPGSTASRFLHVTMQAFFDGIDPALAKAAEFVTVLPRQA